MIYRIINNKVQVDKDIETIESISEGAQRVYTHDGWLNYEGDASLVPNSNNLELVSGVITANETQDIADAKVKLDTSITVEATRIIEAQYSPLKQRKLLSIAVALQDKQIRGLTLTTEEEMLLQTNRDINDWITSIRVIENLSIYNNVLLADIDWGI